MKRLRSTRRPFRLVAFLAAVPLVVAGVGTTTAGATTVGPCEFRLDIPHRSSEIWASQSVPVLRTHAQYYCRSEVIYVNAQVTLRRCISGSQDPQTCAPLTDGAGTNNSATGVNYNVGQYKILATADSDPYPETGWYVATAVYEVCVFNGGVFPGTQASHWAHWDAEEGKVDRIVQEIPIRPEPGAPAEV